MAAVANAVMITLTASFPSALPVHPLAVRAGFIASPFFSLRFLTYGNRLFADPLALVISGEPLHFPDSALCRGNGNANM
jgi:hypothetical protein